MAGDVVFAHDITSAWQNISPTISAVPISQYVIKQTPARIAGVCFLRAEDGSNRGYSFFSKLIAKTGEIRYNKKDMTIHRKVGTEDV